MFSSANRFKSKRNFWDKFGILITLSQNDMNILQAASMQLNTTKMTGS